MKILTVEEMSNLEQSSIESGIPLEDLMENAGLSTARRIVQILNGIRGKRVMVLVGPGNNGGDGMVAGRYLSDWGGLVTLYMTTSKRRDDKFEECRSRRVRIIENDEDEDHWALSSYLALTDLVLDAILGTGQDRPLDDSISDVLEKVCEIKEQDSSVRFVALDIPTGVNADTGESHDRRPPVDITLTMAAPKIGLFSFPAATNIGDLEILDIGIPPGLDGDIKLEMSDQKLVTRLLPGRALNSNKGSHGRLMVIAGSRNYIGAPVLASMAAYRTGAGLVTLATPTTTYTLVAPQMAEPTYLPLKETPNGQIDPSEASSLLKAFQTVNACVIGPGLGLSESTHELIQNCVLSESVRIPLVIDADGLNALANIYRWPEYLSTPAVLTPHPGEMARLLKMSVEEIQANRLSVAQSASKMWGQVVVLKGAYTVIAAPDDRTCVSPFANPVLASGGTGDVLSGIIGTFLAQGLEPYAAAVAGTYVHSCAAEELRETYATTGVIASDLLPEIPKIVTRLSG